MSVSQNNYSISVLGEKKIRSPLKSTNFNEGDKRLLLKCHIDRTQSGDAQEMLSSVELAGPSELIYFEPSKTRAGIVTCGGLCPGINDVIRSVTMELFYGYGVRNILGFRYGFRGLIPNFGHKPFKLSPDSVKDINNLGGSILSCSRGHQDTNKIIDTLIEEKINILFCIGGDGTMRAAEEIARQITQRNLMISIIGIPKTIDNDLNLIQKSFGFDTAIEETVKAIRCAHVEAKGALNGIGLVKIMGRHSGHIAANAALAQSDVNFVLIPEVPFDLDGKNGFLHHLEKRISKSGHAVILVAEGAGQEFLKKANDQNETDPSGNVRLQDIGIFLKNEITAFFEQIRMEINLKYIEPSYMIRSVSANASDSIYCSLLGQYAVHAGMAGKTSLLVALLREDYVILPLGAVSSRRKINPQDNLWSRVLESTGQPPEMKN